MDGFPLMEKMIVHTMVHMMVNNDDAMMDFFDGIF